MHAPHQHAITLHPPFKKSGYGPACDPDNLDLQGRSQGGVQGVQLNPPSKLMIFMTIVIPWKN